MNKLMTVVSAAALLAASSLAALAEEATGMIQSVDPTTMTVTLDDGNTYKLPADFDAASLQVGARVIIEYETDASGALSATSVEPQA